MNDDPNIDMDAFLAEFKKRFTECGYKSYRMLAAAMNVDVTTITKIATYKRRPTEFIIKKLAEAFDESPAKWLKLAGYETTDIKYALKAEYDLPPETIAQIEAIIEKHQKEHEPGGKHYKKKSNE